MTLSHHADVSIFEIVCYALLLPLCVFCIIKHGIKGQSGFVLLTLHCTIRIAASGMFVAETTKSSKGYITATTILLQIALGPLISALVSFVNVSYQKGLGGMRMEKGSIAARVLRITHLMVIASIALGIVGGIKRSDATTPSSIDSAVTITQVSSCLLVAVLVIITALFSVAFGHRHSLGDLQQKLFLAILASLPLLWIRLVYSMLGAFHLNTSTKTHTQKFSTTAAGNWVIYLLLGAIPQILVVALWAGAGAVAKKDTNKWDRDVEMDRSEQVNYQGQQTFTQ